MSDYEKYDLKKLANSYILFISLFFVFQYLLLLFVLSLSQQAFSPFDPRILFIFIVGYIFVMLVSRCNVWRSRRRALKVHSVKIIQEGIYKNGFEKDLFLLVQRISQLVGLKKMPQVGSYESPDINAFAVGSPSKAVIACSTAVRQLTIGELEAIIAHEIGHIVSKDSLVMSVLTDIIYRISNLFFVPYSALALHQKYVMRKRPIEERVLLIPFIGIGFIFLGLGNLFKELANFFINYHSRSREYRADAIAAICSGKDNVINLLQSLANDVDSIPLAQQDYNQFKINNNDFKSILTSTHPPIEKRIEALENDTYINKALKKEFREISN
ncbi:MAG: hypothetical protein D3907_00095 [Candidatus Electrothrix sp. AUS3]|nr:hypothetical protein [Candidatus Electrothrix gigas]